jgi:hypothetical protein
MAYSTLGEYFNPANVLSQAEQIKTQRQQRALQEQLAPYQLQMAQLQPQMRQLEIAKAQQQMQAGPQNAIDLMGDKNLTEWDLMRALKMGTPEQQAQAQSILDAKKQFGAESYSQKYSGGMTDKGIDFAAKTFLTSGKMPPMGRSPQIRAQIMEKAADVAANAGMTVEQLMSMQSEKKGYAVSLGQQLKQRGSMGSFIRNIDSQVNLLQEKLPDLVRANTRIANLPIRDFRKRIQGSADEAIFETILGEISTEIAKLASGATGSVAQVSEGAREKWDKIHDPNLPVKEIWKLANDIKHLGELRLKSVDDEINFTKKKLGQNIGTDYKTPQQKFEQAKSKNRTVTRRGKTKDGRTVVQYSDGSIEYAK